MNLGLGKTVSSVASVAKILTVQIPTDDKRRNCSLWTLSTLYIHKTRTLSYFEIPNQANGKEISFPVILYNPLVMTTSTLD